MIRQELALVDGRAGTCELKQTRRTDTRKGEPSRAGIDAGSAAPSSTQPDAGNAALTSAQPEADEGSGCALSTGVGSGYAGIVVGLGMLVARSRRRRTRGTAAR